MRSAVFAHLNNLPLLVTGYHAIRIGPYLRREKSKRRYSDYFSFQKGWVAEMLDSWKAQHIQRRLPVVDDPFLSKIEVSANTVYRFNSRIKWNDFFEGVKEHRPLVIRLFWEFVSKKYLKELSKLQDPVIGVHIRLGDFRHLEKTEVFREVGGVRTPEEYFINVITSIRNFHGGCLPVSIFSDGFRHELSALLKMENVLLIEGNSDIVDLMLLSRSKIIVASAGSTFGYWAGFLSKAPLILHPEHIHEPIRDGQSGNLYEGPWDETNEMLTNYVKEIPFRATARERNNT